MHNDFSAVALEIDVENYGFSYLLLNCHVWIASEYTIRAVIKKRIQLVFRLSGELWPAVGWIVQLTQVWDIQPMFQNNFFEPFTFFAHKLRILVEMRTTSFYGHW